MSSQVSGGGGLTLIDIHQDMDRIALIDIQPGMSRQLIFET